MIQDFVDYGSWNNLLKGNYRKGANVLRSILTDPNAASKMVADGAAVMAIYGDTDYADGSCLCANVIGNTDFAPAAFNHYLNLIGVSDYDTWAESAADMDVLYALADNGLAPVVQNSPKLLSAVPKRTLNNDSWAQIKAFGEAGVHGLVYSIGDTKDVALSDIGTMTMEIADFDHDYLAGNVNADKAPFTFLTKELLYSKYQMNSTNTNNGGFIGTSALRTTLNGTIINSFPSELKNVIEYTYKWYGTGNNSENGQWNGLRLWIPLVYELCGGDAGIPTFEHESGNARRYPIFTDNESRKKKLSNGAGTVNDYWTATPGAGETSFWFTSSGGNCSRNVASAQYGVCFGFCI